MAPHFKLLLVLTLCTLSVSGQLLYSINCGTATPSSSVSVNNDFITWMGDGDLFQTGTSTQVVQHASSVSDVMDTLRVFTSRRKNCYNFKVDRNTQVLVRASFNYGNYDMKSSPPTFDLLFDGNFWDTVETSSDYMVYYEAIYVVKGDYTSICVAQTKPNQFPFMSALEVRSLDSNMYSKVDSSVALFLQNRTAYGADSAIRFSDDLYDRIWEPASIEARQLAVTSTAILITDSGYADKPPQAMLQHAITTQSTSDPIILNTGLPAGSSKVYINLYFSEVEELDSTQRRSFTVYNNNESHSAPILPPYGSAYELYLNNSGVSSSMVFSLVATTDSNLPPIINGMEVFKVSDVLSDGTNIKDVNGLTALQNAFTVLNDWGGDPCLPSPYSWEWVNCSSDAIPRITAINLESFGLDGLIPDLSSMDALVTINLRNNSIVGPIPDTLGSLSNLKQLNVANNKLSGPIPTSLTKNNKLELTWTGNPSLCKSGCQVNETPGYAPANPSSGAGGYSTPAYVSSTRPRGSKKSKTPVIVGTTIPALIVFWAIVGFLIVLRKRRTAAVAAAIEGAANRPNGKPHPSGHGSTGMNSGDHVMNDFTVNVEQQDMNVEMSGDQPNTQQQPLPQ